MTKFKTGDVVRNTRFSHNLFDVHEIHEIGIVLEVLGHAFNSFEEIKYTLIKVYWLSTGEITSPADTILEKI